MEIWFLTAEVRKALAQARASGVLPSAEQLEAYTSMVLAADTSRVLSIAGGNAEIHIKGVLTNAPDWMAAFFGGGNTTYPEIISAVAEADANPEVEETILRFDSGGGSVFGMFEAIDAIRAAKKPVKAIIGTMAASAAFALAAAADERVASSRASVTGSIGTAADIRLREDVVTLSSTEAPNKRPDVTTEAGKAVIVAGLDTWHALFVESIAEDLGTTVKKVNADFGRGAAVLAEDALKRGMIDSIATTRLESVKSTKSTTASSGNSEVQNMDIQELKAKHPALYQAAVDEGKTIGATAERDRVGAHLQMGTSCHDMKTALEAVADGSEMTATLTAKYLCAGRNHQDIGNRQGDDEAAAAANNAQGQDNVEAGADVAALVEAATGMGAQA